jgi:hypothetical protein
VADTNNTPQPEHVESTPSTASTIFQSVSAAGIAAAGAALAADGAIGIGGQRKGLHGLGKFFIWGAILVILGIFMLISGILEAFGAVSPTEGSTPGDIIFSSILMVVIGIFVAVIGAVKLAVRAGSVAGGLLLLREGMKRGESIANAASAKPTTGTTKPSE